MVQNTESLATIRDYRASIEICRKEFNGNNDKTERGATPAAFMGGQSGPAGWEPSAYRIYNDWADTILKRLIEMRRQGELAGAVNSQAAFDEFHRGLVSSLEGFWIARAHPDYPPSRKLLHKLDLFAKWLRMKVQPEIRLFIEQYGHTTLNTPTLKRLTALLDDETLDFPPDADFDGWYVALQERIRVLTREHGGSPVIVDMWSRKSYLGDPDEEI